jgi:hypothetical protein
MGPAKDGLKYFAILNSNDQHINQQVSNFFARKTSTNALDGLLWTA